MGVDRWRGWHARIEDQDGHLPPPPQVGAGDNRTAGPLPSPRARSRPRRPSEMVVIPRSQGAPEPIPRPRGARGDGQHQCRRHGADERVTRDPPVTAKLLRHGSGFLRPRGTSEPSAILLPPAPRTSRLAPRAARGAVGPRRPMRGADATRRRPGGWGLVALVHGSHSAHGPPSRAPALARAGARGCSARQAPDGSPRGNTRWSVNSAPSRP